MGLLLHFSCMYKHFSGCEHSSVRASVRAVWGVNGSFAILYSVLLEAGTGDKLTLSLLSSTNTVISQLGALAVGPLYDRFGPRLMTVFAILFGVQLILSFVFYAFSAQAAPMSVQLQQSSY